MVDATLAGNRERINSKQGFLESGEMQSVPNRPGAMVVGWGWMRVDLQR